MSDDGWRPLLDGDDADRARDAITAVARDLRRLAPTDASLYYGQAGIALLHGYLARAGQDDAIDHAAESLEAAAAGMDQDRMPWLARGLAGIGLALTHLDDLIEIDPDTLEQIDEAVGGVVDRPDWPFDWELMPGLIGLGVYGLERAGCAGGRGIVERVVAHLGRLARRGSQGAAWLGRIRDDALSPEVAAQNPAGYYNAGMPYGAAGAIALLAAAREAGVPGPDPALLADAVTWLRARDQPGADLRFPVAVATGYRDPPDRSANGWCYGDPMIALVLTWAGRVAGQPAWTAHAVDVARHAAAWARAAAPRSDNLSLCHGTAGRGHLFNRLAQATGSAELEDAARLSFRQVLAARRPGSGLGGFSGISAARGESATAFEHGLQLGAAGVALALLAAISDVAPDWDRALLINLAPAG